MGTVTGTFPGRPFRLRAVTTLVRQDVAGNRSLLHTELWIDKLSYSPTWSADGTANRAIDWNGNNKLTTSGNGFDFQASGPWKIATYEQWVGHHSDGTMTVDVVGRGNYDQLGSTTTATDDITLPTIPRTVPPAPSPVGLDQITTTSMRYRFSSNGSGDTPIIKWQYQVDRDGDFSSPRTVDIPNGTTTISDLAPANTYYVRARGVNSAGPGPWSSRSSATTLGTVPPAPTPIGLDQITRTSMRFRFSSNGTGDLPLSTWQYQVSSNEDFTSARTVNTVYGGNIIDGLAPGILYYVRVRGINQLGSGPWSTVSSARTLSGAYISTGTEWVPAEVLISDGSKWLPTDPVISDGSTWKPTA